MQYSDEDSVQSYSENSETGSHNVSPGSPEMSRSENTVAGSLSGGEPKPGDSLAASQGAESPETSQSENTVTDSLNAGEPKLEDSLAASEGADQPEEENPQDVVGALSLRTRTLASLAEAFVRNRELDEAALSRVQMLPDFWSAVKAALYKDADCLESTPKTLELMYQSLKQERDVDVGPFSTLSIPDLAVVLDRLSEGGEMQNLNLSGRSTLNKDELECLIKHTRALQALYLMGARSSLSVTDLTGLQLPGDIYHNVLLERALLPQDWRMSLRGRKVIKPSMPEFPSVEHSLRHIAYVTITGRYSDLGKSSLPTSGIEWSDLSVDGSEPTNKHRPEVLGDGKKCRKYCLTDTPMPLCRLIIGLRNLFEWWVSPFPLLYLDLMPFADLSKVIQRRTLPRP